MYHQKLKLLVNIMTIYINKGYIRGQRGVYHYIKERKQEIQLQEEEKIKMLTHINSKFSLIK